MATLKLSLNKARSAVINVLKAGLVPMLHGSPGIGKSATIHGVAAEFKLKLIDFRASQADPSDVLGFPKTDGKKATYLPFDTFPLEGDPVPEGFEGWLLFLDELPLASPEVQKALYKLILDRMIGGYHLHERVRMVAAGNLETDGAMVEPLSTALSSRMIHLEVYADFLEWQDWALAEGFDFRILSYLNYKKENFYNFRGDLDGYTYACPRTWEMINRQLAKNPEVSSMDIIQKATFSGTVGEGVAPEFIAFCEIEKEIPTFKAILSDPEGVTLPSRMDTKWLISGMVAKEITDDNLEVVGKFIKKLPIEFQIVTLKGAVKRDMKLMNNPTVLKWIAEAAATKFQ